MSAQPEEEDDYDSADDEDYDMAADPGTLLRTPRFCIWILLTSA